MIIDLNKSLGSLAAEAPGAIRTLDQLGLDYCCGGASSVKDACIQAGIDPEELKQRLEQSIDSREEDQVSWDWQTDSLSNLVMYIIDKHHTFTKMELARLEPLAAKVCSAHGQNHEELFRIQAIIQTLKHELVVHMLKEEQILFPHILRMEEAAKRHEPAPPAFFGSVVNPMRMMMMEHDTAGQALEEIRKVSSNFQLPPDSCASFDAFYRALPEFEADLRHHIHLENNVLFPRALTLEGSY